MTGNVDSLLVVEKLVTLFRERGGILAGFRPAGRPVVRAVDGVSLTVRRGEMLALVGESGSGKTTTALSILRMLRPAEGRIEFEGRDITRLNHGELRPLRRRMQMIFQDPYESLDPRFRAEETVEEPLEIHGIGNSRRERRRLALEALERVGLTPAELYAKRFPHELSGGQRQRVAIAASLMLDPALLVADEPVSMLDVSVRAGILSLLADLRRQSNMGILSITHDLATAVHFADRIAVMYLGRIVEEAPSAELIRRPLHPYTRALLSAVPRADPRARTSYQILSGEIPNPRDLPNGCRFHPRCPLADAACTQVDPELRGGADRHAVACLKAPSGDMESATNGEFIQ